MATTKGAGRTHGNGPAMRGDGEAGGYRPRVVVKFEDYVRLPYREGVEEEVQERDVGPWEKLEGEFPGIRLRPLWTADPETIEDMVKRAVDRDPTYRPPNLLGYYVIESPTALDVDGLARELSSWRTVRAAYVEGGPVPPPVVATDDPRSINQVYLDPAPDGIDAEAAWTVPGGDGSGIDFVDMEQGWTLNHEDLNAKGITLISGVNRAWFGHGTAVLGEVVAVDNTVGGIGIVPEVASARVVSQWRTSTTYSTADAILSALTVLGFGDVLLLEAQTVVAGSSYLPVEVELAVFDAIRLGSALGVVVVEAAGNGGNDLDTYNDASFGQVLNRASADFRDSGAIMVGAASSTTPHNRLGFSNHGSRIDCYGWGQNIDTTGDGGVGNLTTTYTTSFGGTSGASPIVSGAALSLQGMALANLGMRFSPLQLRSILSDPALGTPSANPVTDRIGVMPDLGAAIGSLLGLKADVYIRDFVGDVGDPHTGAISASPDIIVRPNKVGNPQAAFGEGSGTENDNTLGHEVEAGQPNYIYVRVRNRGAGSTDVDAQVYWSPVATLVSPHLWTLVGSTVIQNVPDADILTVSDPGIKWPPGQIPGKGHYCFVGLIGTADDPPPLLADLMNFDNFRAFIRENNNVTWRNFNVVNNVPPAGASPPHAVPLPFMLAGAADRARRMRLEVVARLPRGARVWLEAPMHLRQVLQRGAPWAEHDPEREVVTLAVKPHGRQAMADMLLPAKAQFPMRLLVRIPEERRSFAYEIYARQLYEGEEVGRVTWRLAPPSRTAGARQKKG